MRRITMMAPADYFTRVNVGRRWLASAVLVLLSAQVQAQVVLKAGEFGSGGAEMAGGTFLMTATVGQVFGHVSHTLSVVHGTGLWYVQAGRVRIVGTEEGEFAGDEIPENFELDQNYPNPFNPETTIRFGVPENSFVRVTVYNMLGRRMKVLVNEQLNPGYYTARWDGRSADGSHASSGMYLYVMEGQDFRYTRKMVLIK